MALCARKKKKKKFKHAKVVQSPEYPDFFARFKRRWFDLPKEIRLHILSFTDLVVKDHPHHAVSGLRIHDGKVLSNSRSPVTPILFEEEYKKKHQKDGRFPCRLEGGLDCPCQNTARSILEVDNIVFHREAMEVLLSYNRIIFEPQKPKQILKWLESQGRSVRKIKQMDIQFSLFHETLHDLSKCSEWNKAAGAQYHSWTILIAYIRDHLWLQKLQFSIDAGLDAVLIRTHSLLPQTKKQWTTVKNCFSKMVKPLYDFGPKQGLKSFSAFFSCGLEAWELKAERLVMGPGYRPDGKVRQRSRSSWHPHGQLYIGTNGEAQLVEAGRIAKEPSRKHQNDTSSEDSSSDSDSSASSSFSCSSSQSSEFTGWD
ncbi:hypothetical protein MMC10_004344 [Thelotrema lepadinum]|nr:hypothetical protein [Thelotrema lepadinum]